MASDTGFAIAAIIMYLMAVGIFALVQSGDDKEYRE